MIKSLLLAVAIVTHEPGYYTSLAKHIQRWLRDEAIPSQVITPAQMSKSLATERLAFLVGFVSPTAGEIKTLRSFCARGGKLVVFHSSSAELAALMGVKPAGYRAAAYPGEWSRMHFVSKIPNGLPTSVLQTSTVLQRIRTIPGQSRVMATWANRAGKSTGEPAWIASGNGYWMSHVLLADGDEALKAQLLGAIVGSVLPKAWTIEAHRVRAEAKARELRNYALAQTPRAGEIHAVWDHSGCGLYPGDWPRTIRLLKESRVTDLFVNVAGSAFAHYPSSVLPRSQTYVNEGDQLAACLAAAKGTGIRVHPWIICFSATRGSPERMASYRKSGLLLTNTQGKLTEYLNPSSAAVRAPLLAAIEEIQAKYAVAGIHLDFVRYGDGTVRPRDSVAVISQFVAEARKRVKRPRWLTAAVYGKYPNCIATVSQDWYSWIDMGIVDYVVPMDYCESIEKFEELLKQHVSSRSHARKTIVGIGVTANESRLDARKVIDQIRMVRQYGLVGMSLFDLDTTLEKNILPYLRLGIW